jgi:Tfp pilus assembly protein PilZ
MQERRKSLRKPLAASLEIYTHDAKKSLGKGFITNLGTGGIALETHKHLRLGEKLLLRFTLPKERSFDLKGEIIYAQDGVLTKAYGAKFYDMHPDTSTELQDFIVETQAARQVID